MPSVLGNLAAICTAFVYMILCVGSQPSSTNAPAALLLHNGAIVMIPNRNSDEGMEMFNKNYLPDQSANPCLVHCSPTYEGPNEGNVMVDRQCGQPRIQDQQQLSDPFNIDISSGECKQLGNARTCNRRKVFPNSYETDVDMNTVHSFTNQPCTATTSKVSSTIPKSKTDVSRRITGGVEDSRRTTWDLISNAGYSKFDRLTKLNRTDVQIRKLNKSTGGLFHSAAEDETCCTRTRVRPKPSERDRDCSIHANFDKHLSKGGVSSTKPIPPVRMHRKDLSSKRCSCEDVSNEVWAQNKTGDSNMMYKRHSKNVPQQKGKSEVSNDETTIHNRGEYAGFVQSGQNHRGCNCINRMISGSVGVPSGESVTAPQNQWPRRLITDARSRFVSGNRRGEFERHDCYGDVSNQNRNALNRVSSGFDSSGTNIDGVQYFDSQAMGTGSVTDLKDPWQPAEEHRRLPTCDRDSFRNMGRFNHENNGVESYRFSNAKCVLEPEVNGVWSKEQPQPMRFQSDPLPYRGENMNNGKPLRKPNAKCVLEPEVNGMWPEDQPQPARFQSDPLPYRGENMNDGKPLRNPNAKCFLEPEVNGVWSKEQPQPMRFQRDPLPCRGEYLLTNENSEWCNQQLEYKLTNVLPILNSAHLGRFNNISPHLLQNYVPLESAGRYELLKGLPCCLNQHCECRGLGNQVMFCARNNWFIRPRPLNRHPCPLNLGIHGLPLMASLIHHSPMATNNRRRCRFLPPDSLPLASCASFVKDQDNFWWLIHYEILL